MDIEFDPAKDATNQTKHGVSLAFGERLYDDSQRVVIKTVRTEDGEERRKVIGLVDGKLWIAVHVLRGETTRMISVRRANDAEQRTYDRA